MPMDADQAASSEEGGESSAGRHGAGGSWAGPSSGGGGGGSTVGAALSSRVSHRRSPQDSSYPSNSVINASSYNALPSVVTPNPHFHELQHQAPGSPLPVTDAADRLSRATTESDNSPDSPFHSLASIRAASTRAMLRSSSIERDSVPAPFRALLNHLSDFRTRSNQTLQTIEAIRDGDLHRPDPPSTSDPPVGETGGQSRVTRDDVTIRDTFMRDFHVDPHRDEPENEEDTPAAAAERYRLGGTPGMDIQVVVRNSVY
jgi:predicted component of type VI protein secretion system